MRPATPVRRTSGGPSSRVTASRDRLGAPDVGGALWMGGDILTPPEWSATGRRWQPARLVAQLSDAGRAGGPASGRGRPEGCYHPAPSGPSRGSCLFIKSFPRPPMARPCAIWGRVAMGGLTPRSPGMNRVRPHRRYQPNLQPTLIV